MTSEKLLQIAKFYREKFHEIEIAPLQSNKPLERACYCSHMIDQLVHWGKIDKAMRWLGFIQGVLFSQGIFTIDELKNHSRQNEPPFIECPKCGMKSYNEHDIIEMYCGNCHKFHSEMNDNA